MAETRIWGFLMSRPVVAIIGRPNVGKSTLFNRLVGGRVSITEDTPGVTRDRLYREVEWQNNYFLLMDTGGLELGSDDVFAKEIEIQVDMALETADLILFLVDGREGVSNLDRMIAEKLHKGGRDPLVVVNKVDTHHTPDTVYEFYELGFPDMAIISAEQSFGLGDLLDEIIDRLPKESSHSIESDALKISVIGKPNVGKSSLINQLLGENRMIVTNIPGTTRDAIDSYYERDGKEYILIDTAGMRRQRSIDNLVERYSVIRTLSSVDRSEMCLFLIDATMGVTEQDKRIAGYAHNNAKASIIVVNKWDLVEKETNTMKEYEDKIRNDLAFMPYAPVVFISAKTGYHIGQLFETLNRVDDNYSCRMPTSLFNQVLRDATIMSPPPTDKGKRLKIYYGTQVTTRPPKIIFYCNDADMFHFSYMRYLENTIRKNFAFEGVPLVLEARERKEREE